MVFLKLLSLDKDAAAVREQLEKDLEAAKAQLEEKRASEAAEHGGEYEPSDGGKKSSTEIEVTLFCVKFVLPAASTTMSCDIYVDSLRLRTNQKIFFNIILNCENFPLHSTF